MQHRTAVKSAGWLRWSILSLLMLALVMTAAYSTVTQAKYINYKKTYGNPVFHGYRLHYCYHWTTGCGKTAAHAFCRHRGDGYVVGYAIKHHSPPTRIIGTNQICHGYHCNSFKYITCGGRYYKPSKYKYLQHTFTKPYFGGYRLNYCYRGHSSCGYASAKAFCTWKGFKDADRYKRDRDVMNPTRYIGNGHMCHHGSCDGFQYIKCAR